MASPPPQRRHEPVPGNPYAQPVPAPRRRRAAVAVWVTAAVLVLAGVGGGLYAVTRGDDDSGGGGFREPAARETRESARPPGSGERADGPGAAPVRRVDVNAGRKPGEARGWLALNDVRLPGKGALLNDLWTVDDLVVQAEYDQVTAYRVRGGEKAWTVRLPAPVCDSPVRASPGGKVVLALTNGNKTQGRKCDRLQQLDLRTGDLGWHRSLTAHGLEDSTIIVHLAISGGTLAVGQGDVAHGYRVRDGKRLFTVKPKPTGPCSLQDVAGGERLLLVDTCAPGAPRAHGQVKRIDPGTGEVRWRYRTETGWKVDKIYSVDPLVLAVRDTKTYENWAVVSVDGSGRQRARIDLGRGRDAFEMCDGAGDAGEGVQNCPGGAVGDDRIYLPTKPADGILGPNRVVAFDLATGRRAWSASVQGRQLTPVRQSGAGRSGVVVYVRPDTGAPGRTVRFAATGGAPRTLLRHPTPARRWEADMFAGETLYSGGRLFVAPSRLNPKSLGGKKEQGRLVSYGR
ncbi:PQQ-binding-like beta-propeller repeat protein [Streptomyces sp. PmtG]